MVIIGVLISSIRAQSDDQDRSLKSIFKGLLLRNYKNIKKNILSIKLLIQAFLQNQYESQYSFSPQGGIEYAKVKRLDNQAQWSACMIKGAKDGRGCLFRLIAVIYSNQLYYI